MRSLHCNSRGRVEFDAAPRQQLGAASGHSKRLFSCEPQDFTPVQELDPHALDPHAPEEQLLEPAVTPGPKNSPDSTARKSASTLDATAAAVFNMSSYQSMELPLLRF